MSTILVDKEDENKKLRVANADDLDHDGEFSVGCGNTCRLMCCVRPTSTQSVELSTMAHIREMNRNLEQISNKLKSMENDISVTEQPQRAVESMNQDNRNQRFKSSEPETSRNMKNCKNSVISWIHDKCFVGFEQDTIDNEEDTFWRQMIEKYLKPLPPDPEEQERIRNGLTALRNKASSTFFMSNIVFIVIVLILQMQKDCLHIEWPLGPKFNHTLVPCNSEDGKEVWVLTRLQLEPIGLVFLMFFMSILLIQFLAMLMHRIGTLAHIIASTRLFCWSRPKQFSSGNHSLGRVTATGVVDNDKLEAQNAVEIARELQAIRGTNIGTITSTPLENDIYSSNISSIHAPTASRRNYGYANTLDDAFRQRFFALSTTGQSHPVLETSTPAVMINHLDGESLQERAAQTLNRPRKSSFRLFK